MTETPAVRIGELSTRQKCRGRALARRQKAMRAMRRTEAADLETILSTTVVDGAVRLVCAVRGMPVVYQAVLHAGGVSVTSSRTRLAAPVMHEGRVRSVIESLANIGAES